MPRLVPNSGGLEHFADAADLGTPLSEIGWTVSSRNSAALARKSKRTNKSQAAVRSVVNRLKTGSGDIDMKALYPKGKESQRDAAIQNVMRMYGPEAGKKIHNNLSIRVGLRSKTATAIRSTFISNDGKSVYTGTIRGMRQRIMSWAKTNKKVLPAGFENRSPSAIAGMFRGMARANYFGSKKS